MEDLPTSKVQLSQHVLSVGISSLRRPGEPLQRAGGILFDMLAFEQFLGQPVHGVAASVDRGGVQPIHSLLDIPYLHIIGEVQLGEGVLRHYVSLLSRLHEPISGFRRVGDQQRVIPPELSHQVLGVPVAALCQLVHFRDGVTPLLHGQTLVPDDIPQCPVVVGGVAVFLRLIILAHVFLLEADLTQVQALRFLNDRVLDLRKLFLM